MTTSCNKEPLDIETVSLTDDLYIQVTDTITPQYLVYRLDSFATSGGNMAIIGGATDPEFGRIESSVFARLKLAVNNYQTVGASNEFYDSIVLIMHTDSTYYGDTLSSFDISVHELRQEFDETKTYYNHHSMWAKDAILGQASVKFRPNVDDSVRVKLNQSFGEAIFALYKKNDPKVQTQEEFQRYFKGIKLKSGANNNVIYRFPISDSTFVIRLYFHEDLGNIVTKHLDFAAEGGTFQFNAINCDVSGTPLADLAPGKEILSEALGHHVYMNDLAGISTKISFPSAPVLATLPDYVRIADAVLQLKPSTNSFPVFPLPLALGMSLTNESSLSSSPLYSADQSYVQDGNLYVDAMNGQQTAYSYDMGAYIRAEVIATPTTTVTANLQVYVNGSLGTFSMSRLVANDNTHPAKPSILQVQAIFYKK